MAQAPPPPATAPIDPTANVLALVAAAITRLDDLRVAAEKRLDEKINHEIRALRDLSAKDRELSEKESARIDAIRAVDVAAVASATGKASDQAVVLANQVTTSFESNRLSVAATVGALSDRIAALERGQYTSGGSSTGMRDMWGWVFGIGIALVTLGLAAVTFLSK